MKFTFAKRLGMIGVGLCLGSGTSKAYELSYYYDARDFTTLNLLVAQPDLGAGFSMWGFVDLHGPSQAGQDPTDLKRGFVEFRISNSYFGELLGQKNLELELEYNDALPTGAPLLRGGLTYKVDLADSVFLKFRAFPFSTASNGRQVGIAGGARLGRFQIVNFVDYNIAEKTTAQGIWVTETELRYYISENFRILAELRYSGYEKSNPFLKGFSPAIGLGGVFD